MGVHPATAKASHVKNAKEIIASRDSIWRAWDKTSRVIVGILNVDTDTRHAMISEGLKNLKLANNDEERLHFVKTFLSGHPACPELADYGQQVNQTQPAVKNLGGGKFSVDDLVGDTASNEVEKTEVATTDQVSNETAQQAKETLDQLGYGVYATESGSKSEHLQRAENNTAAATALAQSLNDIPDNDFAREEMEDATALKNQSGATSGVVSALEMAIVAVVAMRKYAEDRNVEYINFGVIGELISVAGGMNNGL